MGNQVSLVPKVSYEDLQMVVYRNMHVQHSTLLINTLPPSLQHCLIKTTVDIRFEERVVNAFIHKKPDIMIIVYGKNSNDITILHKYEQLVKLGFTNVHIYTGGIFEWMLLHEIYGKDLFKITKYEIDILRYRPKSVLLTEMAGDAAILIDATNTEELLNAMLLLSTNEEKRQELMQKGMLQSAKFKWDNAAIKTKEVYYSVLKGLEK